MREPNFADGCILTQVYSRVRSDFCQGRWREGGVSHQDLKYAHQQILIHLKIKIDLILLPFSGEKLVSFQCVAAKGNMMFHGLRTKAGQEQGGGFAGTGKILRINNKIKKAKLIQAQRPAEI